MGNHKLKLLLVTIIGLVIGACKSNSGKTTNLSQQAPLTTEQFNSLSPKSQANYFNSVPTDSRMAFLSQIVPSSSWNVPPNDTVYFIGDGSFVYATSSKKYSIGKWRIEGQTFVLSQPKSEVDPDFVPASGQSVLSAPTAENNPNATEGQDFLSLTFSVNSSSETIKLLLIDPNTASDQFEEAMKFYKQGSK